MCGLISFIVNIPAKVVNYFLDSLSSTLNDLFSPGTNRTVLKIKTDMQRASSLQQWTVLAEELDKMEGKDAWKAKEKTAKYDYKLIKSRLNNFKTVAQQNDISSMMFLIRAGLIRNLGGIGKPELYSMCNVGTKKLIEDYIDEIVNQIDRIAWCQEPEITLNMKIDYLADVLHSFGKTALIFHGGASFGLCHLGVAKALHDAQMLPKVICGSYIGALIAGLICAKTGEELSQIFAGDIDIGCFARNDSNGSSLKRKIVRLLKHGRLFDIHVIEECAKDNIGDITFKEAYVKTGRILNIIVHAKRKHEVPVLLNYLTAPDVVIWSAASAACAVPGIYDAATLMAKDSKGSIVPWNPSAIRLSTAKIVDEIPISRLTEMFNVNNFIVSHVPSYFSISHFSERPRFLFCFFKWAYLELKHRFFQLRELGLIPQYFMRLIGIFSTPHVGDIQITPQIWNSDFAYIFSNPTPEFIRYCIGKGQHATWLHMTQVHVRCAIEFELERMISALKSQRSRNKA